MASTIDPNEVPQEVKDAFAQKFPGTEADKWESESAYEVEFSQNGKGVEANFLADGTLAQVEYEMDVDDLPMDITQAVKHQYPHCEIIEAERVVKADGTVLFELGLSFEVHMTPEGKVAAMGKDL